MSASRKSIGSDLAKVDAHVITAAEYEEIPELTDAEFARGTVMVGGVPAKRGRPKLDSPKRLITLRLDADVIDTLRQLGAGWQTRANEMLREALRLRATSQK